MRIQLSRVLCCVFLLLTLALQAQTPLTNDSIIKMVKAGLGEDVIVNMVNLQPAKYALGPDDLIALKKDGVTDKIIAAMLKKAEAPAAAAPAAGDPLAAPAPAPPAATAAPELPALAPVSEIGVYVKKAGAWAQMDPEVVNWKTGGVLKTIGTAGIVKGDVNGRLNGTHSNNQLKSPLEFLIYVPEGVGITEYQLLRLRESKNAREFRTVTGGVLHVSGGATRDLVNFDSKKIASRTYTILLDRLTPGEYGFLPPGSVSSSHASATLGKMYSFRLIE